MVRSLIHFDRIGDAGWDPIKAAEKWAYNVGRAYQMEQALGESRVRRITYDGLIADPETTLKGVLEFAGEPWDPNCVLPLQERINSSKIQKKDELPGKVLKSKPFKECLSLYEKLQSTPVPRGAVQAAADALQAHHLRAKMDQFLPQQG